MRQTKTLFETLESVRMPSIALLFAANAKSDHPNRAGLLADEALVVEQLRQMFPEGNTSISSPRLGYLNAKCA